MRGRLIVRGIIPLVLPYLMLSGCSLIGFGIGAMIDGSQETYRGPVTAIDFVEVGSKVGITKTDSSRVMGRFQGIQTAPEQAYAISYLRRVTALDSLTYAPAYNEQVLLITRTDTMAGLFRGFDRNTAWVAATELHPAHGRNLDSIDWIEGQFGRRTRGWQLRDMIIAGRIPSRSVARVSAEEVTQAIPLEAVASVTVLTSSGGGGSAKWVGLGVGILVDVLVFIAIMETNETANDCNSSCSKSYTTYSQ